MTESLSRAALCRLEEGVLRLADHLRPGRN